MAFLLAGRLTPTNVALLDAARELGTDAVLLPPELAASRARPGDVLLPRLDVLPTLDGIEPGLSLMDAVARRGVQVVNRAGTIAAAHDKLATALRLSAAGVPHPRTGRGIGRVRHGVSRYYGPQGCRNPIAPKRGALSFARCAN